MVVLTASQNLKLMDSVDVEDLKKTWKDTINNDLRHWKLSRADPANRIEWRKKVQT